MRKYFKYFPASIRVKLSEMDPFFNILILETPSLVGPAELYSSHTPYLILHMIQREISPKPTVAGIKLTQNLQRSTRTRHVLEKITNRLSSSEYIVRKSTNENQTRRPKIEIHITLRRFVSISNLFPPTTTQISSSLLFLPLFPRLISQFSEAWDLIQRDE